MRCDLLVAALLAASVALAGDPPAMPPTNGRAALAAAPVGELSAHEARSLALAALTGDAPLQARIDRVAALRDRFGDDAELAAIAANLDAMRAADLPPARAMVVARAAFREIDRLARDHPADPGVRLQRGMGALRAPSLAGRDRIALEEFDALLADFDLAPDLRAFVEARRAEALAKLEAPR